MAQSAPEHNTNESSDRDNIGVEEGLLSAHTAARPNNRYVRLAPLMGAVALICGACIAFAISKGVGGTPDRGRLANSISAQQATKNLCAGGTCGMALAGGGFMAQSSYAGIFAGLMNVSGTTLNQFTEPFASIGGASGGTWFAVSMAYSAQFSSMVSQIAKDPAQAGKIYNQSWVEPLLSLHPANGFGTSDRSEAAKRTVACGQMIASMLRAFEEGEITSVLVNQWDSYLSTLGVASKKAKELEMSIGTSIVEAKAEKAGLTKEEINEKAAKARQTIKTVQKTIKTCLEKEKGNSAAAKAAYKAKEAACKQGQKEASKEAFGMLMSMHENSSFPYFQDLALALGFMQTGGSSWAEMVANVLQKTAGITLETTLGSEPQAWAKGKTLYASTSIPSPKKASGSLGQMQVWVNQDLDAANDWVEYSVTTTQSEYKKYRLYTPGRFTISMGSSAGQNATSPETFCATSDCFGLTETYEGQYSGSKWSSTSPSMGTNFKSAFEDSAGMLPVGYIAGSSSAAFGAFALSRATSGASSTCIDMTTWATSKPGGSAWTAAMDLRLGMKGGRRLAEQEEKPITEATVDNTAATGMTALLDGGYTDGTAIAWQVASGKRRILALMNQAWTWTLLLFGAKSFGAGSLQTLNCQVFSTDWKTVNTTLAAFPKLTLTKNPKWLQAIYYGQIKTTTVANSWFGTSDGEDVTLDIINVVAPHVSEAFLTNYYAYSALAAEVTQSIVLPENKKAVLDMLSAYKS